MFFVNLTQDKLSYDNVKTHKVSVTGVGFILNLKLLHERQGEGLWYGLLECQDV